MSNHIPLISSGVAGPLGAAQGVNLGGVVAGSISDHLFHSRRGPSAGSRARALWIAAASFGVLAALRQKEDWLRCLERFRDKIFEFTRALGNVRNVACSGYTRDSAVRAVVAADMTLAGEGRWGSGGAEITSVEFQTADGDAQQDHTSCRSHLIHHCRGNECLRLGGQKR